MAQEPKKQEDQPVQLQDAIQQQEPAVTEQDAEVLNPEEVPHLLFECLRSFAWDPKFH
jgi:hypothetical protein